MLTLPFDVTAHSLRPARLVKIIRRDGTIYRIAEAQSSVTITDDGIYTPVAGVTLKAIKNALGGEVPSSQMDFAHSSDGFFVSREIAGGLFDGAVVQIYAIDRTNLVGTPALLFTGTIQGLEVGVDGGGSFTFKGKAVTAEAVIRTYMPICDTDLFSPLCGLDPDDFEVAATVTSIIDFHNITVSIGSPPADFYFNDGTGETEDGQAFRIANWFQTGQQITTYQPNVLLFSVGQTLRLWPGCDKLGTTCDTKFNNRINFQGFDHYLGALAATVQV